MTADIAVPLVRLLLAVAYPFIAHAASVRNDGTLAALAIGVVMLMVLVDGLLRRRWTAWLALAACLAALAWLARSAHAQVPLLLVPVAFILLVAWGFGRTLRPGQVPLITRIVAALERAPAHALAPDLYRYTHRLTLGWTWLLAGLAAVNLALAAIAVPDGLLATLGVQAPLTVTEAQWSWFANWFNYGLIGGFFVLEYLYRKRRFPGRYRNFLDFAQRMARLGPAFWRDLLR